MKIKWRIVQRIQERYLYGKRTAAFQHAVNLCQASFRIRNVLEDIEQQHMVSRTIRKRKLLCIAENVRARLVPPGRSVEIVEPQILGIIAKILSQLTLRAPDIENQAAKTLAGTPEVLRFAQKCKPLGVKRSLFQFLEDRSESTVADRQESVSECRDVLLVRPQFETAVRLQ